VGVRIDESGNDDLLFAIDLDDFLAVLFEPGIAEGIFGRADGDYFAGDY
jgi:hypothetical protein